MIAKIGLPLEVTNFNSRTGEVAFRVRVKKKDSGTFKVFVFH